MKDQNNLLNEEFAKDMDKAIIEGILHPETLKEKPKREPRKITVTRTITKEITKCYHECFFFALDGGPSPVMHCTHPTFIKPYSGFIISHPDCDDGFPEKCPLLEENKK